MSEWLKRTCPSAAAGFGKKLLRRTRHGSFFMLERSFKKGLCKSGGAVYVNNVWPK